MKIIVDAMGGDFAPLAPVKGALMAQEKYGVDIVLTGKTEEILKALQQCGCKELPKGMEIANATEVVEICDDPATAFKHKKDSSLTVGLNMLHAGDADGFVSAGSTGALLAGATLLVKRVRGLRRAALAPTIPTAKGKAVLIGVENPRIGLLNIGAEESKGDTLRRETYQKLKEAGEAGHFNFTGNIEAKEAMLGECDVIVADGYSGNIMLKSIEGTGKLLSIKLKEMLMHSTGTKLAALLLKGQLGDFKKMLDANEVGGTALLGISKPVVKAHGSASEVGICNAVRQAMEVARSGIIDDIAQNIDKMRIEQKAE